MWSEPVTLGQILESISQQPDDALPAKPLRQQLRTLVREANRHLKASRIVSSFVDQAH